MNRCAIGISYKKIAGGINMAHRPDNASYLQYRNDTDKSKKFIIKALLLNNRLKKYQDYINYARDHGYRVISLEDFYSLNDRRAEKHFILRHDVDHNGIATKKCMKQRNRSV